jgi:hypothetical protein
MKGMSLSSKSLIENASASFVVNVVDITMLGDDAPVISSGASPA